MHSVVAEYRRANALIRPTPATARVWVSLYQEIEKVRGHCARDGEHTVLWPWLFTGSTCVLATHPHTWPLTMCVTQPPHSSHSV